MVTRLVVVACIAMGVAGCSGGSDSSTAPNGTASGSSGQSSGSTSSSGATSSSGGASSSGGSSGTSSSGSVAACTARYCCNFDGMSCAVDNADVRASIADPSTIVQTQSVSSPSSMRLDSQGSGTGISIEPKTAAGKRVEIDFQLRMETTGSAGVGIGLVDGGGTFAFVVENGALWIYDSGKISAGALTPNAWNAIHVVIDIPGKSYGVSVNGAPPVTRSMTGGVGALFTDVTEVRFALTETLGGTVVLYDDLRVDWN